MADSKVKAVVGNFKKKEHRPWKSSLLETTIQESQTGTIEETIDFSLDLNQDTADTTSPFFADFNFTSDAMDLDLDEKFSQVAVIVNKDNLNLPEMDHANVELRSAIKQTQQQKSFLETQISDRSHNPILLGGFFQPQQLTGQGDSQGTRKMNYLISDLRSKEQELSSLTSNLKISEAFERAEQAELNRRAEEHGRLAAESRMRQAIEQAHIAAEQFRSAMDQANQAALAHREEEQLRKAAEAQIKDAKFRAQNAEIALQNERNARTAAEDKMQQTLQQLADAELAQIQKFESIKHAEENRRAAIEQQYDTLNKNFLKIENEYRESANKIYALEAALKELKTNNSTLEQKLAELVAQRDKLKKIIEGEQDLRKIAEKRAQEALVKADQAEKARAAEEQQRKLVDERAKRAVEHASRTVMHLLNAPVGNEYSMHVTPDLQAAPVVATERPTSEKPKIRVKADPFRDTPITEDDYSF
jgi:hypothetical protein